MSSYPFLAGCFKLTFLFKLVTKECSIYFKFSGSILEFYFVFSDSLMFLDLLNLIIFDCCNSGSPQLAILSLILFLHLPLF